MPPLTILAETLAKYPNPVRVEGHTDNRPISTSTFPSNWELSAARAASVVHLFARGGVDPARLAVIGLGEFRPAQSNDTVDGRNANRRVLIVILGGDQAPEDAFGEDRGVASEPAQPGESATACTAGAAHRATGRTRDRGIARGGRHRGSIPAAELTSLPANSRWHGSCSVSPQPRTPSTP